MVLYQLESLYLDDYNLIYSQNKNRGFDKILTVFPLKTQHFPFTSITKNQSKQQYSSKLNPTQSQNSFTTKTKLFLSTFGVFPNSNTNKRGIGFESYLKSLSNFNTKVPPFFLSLWPLIFIEKFINLPIQKPYLSPFFSNMDFPKWAF